MSLIKSIEIDGRPVDYTEREYETGAIVVFPDGYHAVDAPSRVLIDVCKRQYHEWVVMKLTGDHAVKISTGIWQFSGTVHIEHVERPRRFHRCIGVTLDILPVTFTRGFRIITER